MNNLLAAVLMAVFAGGSAVAGEFKVDDVHSSVNFSIKHMMVSNVKGSFGTFTGKWTIDEKTKEISAFTGEVDVATIDTNNDKRDEHLRKKDFFDTDKHPKASFELLKHHGNRLIAKVTIRGVTKAVEFKTTITDAIDHPMKKGTKVQGITLVGTINRKDFNVGDDYPNKILSEDVVMTIELEGLSEKK